MTTILRFTNKRYTSVTPGVRPYVSFINESQYISHVTPSVRPYVSFISESQYSSHCQRWLLYLDSLIKDIKGLTPGVTDDYYT
jgi:hypothetical protein